MAPRHQFARKIARTAAGSGRQMALPALSAIGSESSADVSGAPLAFALAPGRPPNDRRTTATDEREASERANERINERTRARLRVAFQRAYIHISRATIHGHDRNRRTHVQARAPAPCPLAPANLKSPLARANQPRICISASSRLLLPHTTVNPPPFLGVPEIARSKSRLKEEVVKTASLRFALSRA